MVNRPYYRRTGLPTPVISITEMINRALLPSTFTLDKFGVNPIVTVSSDPEDIWEGGGEYPFSTSADIISISSSNAGDTQDISIQGLGADGREVIQNVTLQGQTVVPLTTPLLRVYRMENESNVNLLGTVYCYSGTEATLGVPSGGSVKKAIINNGNNQTLMAIYTIPLGKVGFLYRGEIGIIFTGAVGTGVNFLRGTYKSRRYGGVFKVKKELSCINQGSSNYVDKRTFPDIIPALTDIKLVAEEVSADMGCWGTFDIMLVDETEFTQEYLTNIGQPSSV